MVNNNNYINIQGFMVKDLGLKGNELLAYALIYGFSQDGETWFTGSSKYIAEWLNIDRRNVLAVLQKLVDKGLLIKNEKIINGVKLCDYKAVIGGDETSQGMMNHHRGYDKTSQGGGDESSHHNNSIDNIEDSIYTRQTKKSYGEFGKVKLTDDEHNKLKQNYGKDLDVAIGILDDYLASKGKKYASHYAVMKKNGWVWTETMKQSIDDDVFNLI